jgi:hypothetical protein
MSLIIRGRHLLSFFEIVGVVNDSNMFRKMEGKNAILEYSP